MHSRKSRVATNFWRAICVARGLGYFGFGEAEDTVDFRGEAELLAALDEDLFTADDSGNAPGGDGPAGERIRQGQNKVEAVLDLDGLIGDEVEAL